MLPEKSSKAISTVSFLCHRQGRERHLLQVSTGVGLGRQLEELLLMLLVDLCQLLLFLQDDVFKGLDLDTREGGLREGGVTDGGGVGGV